MESRTGTRHHGIKTISLDVITFKPLASPHSTPLLFVHGAMHGAWYWAEHFLSYFAAQGYESHAVNLRGHGRSLIDGSLRFTRIADTIPDYRCKTYLACSVSSALRDPIKSWGSQKADRFEQRQVKLLSLVLRIEGHR